MMSEIASSFGVKLPPPSPAATAAAAAYSASRRAPASPVHISSQGSASPSGLPPILFPLAIVSRNCTFDAHTLATNNTDMEVDLTPASPSSSSSSQLGRKGARYAERTKRGETVCSYNNQLDQAASVEQQQQRSSSSVPDVQLFSTFSAASEASPFRYMNEDIHDRLRCASPLCLALHCLVLFCSGLD